MMKICLMQLVKLKKFKNKKGKEENIKAEK